MFAKLSTTLRLRWREVRTQPQGDRSRTRQVGGQESYRILRRSLMQSTRDARALVCRRWLRRLWRIRRPTWWTPPPSVSSRLLRWRPEGRRRRRSGRGSRRRRCSCSLFRLLSGHRSRGGGSPSSALSPWPLARPCRGGGRGRKRNFLVAPLVASLDVDSGSGMLAVLVLLVTFLFALCPFDFWQARDARHHCRYGPEGLLQVH